MSVPSGTVQAELSGVTHVAGRGVTVLADVDLQVHAGRIVVLTGPSGSGKSTVCHLLAGVMQPSTGTVTVLGRPAHEWRDWTRVSLLPQRHALVEELTVAENVAWPCQLAGLDVPPQLWEATGIAHLTHRLVTETSLGEQQRIALARALAPAPALVLLDEPTGHQDDDHVAQVVAAIEAGRGLGSTIVVATHDERLVALADQVVHLADGRVLPDRPEPRVLN